MPAGYESDRSKAVVRRADPSVRVPARLRFDGRLSLRDCGQIALMGMRAEEGMTSGLLAPLSPSQEIALRRIAHGSLIVDAQVVARLMALGLVQQTSRGHRLTPLGRLRYDALPKAPLLTRQRSIHAVTGYVEGIIEKAQARAHAKALDAEINGAASARSMPVGSDEVDDEEFRLLPGCRSRPFVVR